MKFSAVISLLFAFALPYGSYGQTDHILEHDTHSMNLLEEEDPSPAVRGYAEFNPTMGGTKLRQCGVRLCNGWVMDIYPDGVLKHRGLYADGALVRYRNYHSNGQLERDFKQLDMNKSILRTYHSNGTVRSVTHFWDRAVLKYVDHYSDGTLRYAEERHKSEPYYLRMDFFAPNGDPLRLHRLVHRKRIEFEMKAYYPGGGLQSEGRARYDPQLMDTRKVGTWRHYGADGALQREEELQDNKVHSVH